MAPTANTQKRPRPAFSPPRPGKKSKTTSTTSVTKKNGSDRVVKKSTASATGSRNGVTNKKTQSRKETPKQKPRQTQVQRRKAAAGTMRAVLGDSSDVEEEEERGDDDDEDQYGDGRPYRGRAINDSSDVVSQSEAEEDEDEDEDEAEDEDTTRPSRSESEPESHASSPEPEFMLAEVIHHDRAQPSTASKRNTASESDLPIPLPLIHHIMRSQFTTPDKTSLSTDARALMGKYVEAFVLEGIHRCALDRAEREKSRSGGGAATRGDVGIGDDGWLEVEDLERVAVQLCLDF